MKTKFEKFILRHLKQAKVKTECAEEIFKQNKQLFTKVFLHASFQYEKNLKFINSQVVKFGLKFANLGEFYEWINSFKKIEDTLSSYETMEFKGDGYIKAVHKKMLSTAYPDMNQDKLSQAIHQLVGDKQYANEGKLAGFDDWFLVNEKVYNHVEKWRNGLVFANSQEIGRYWKGKSAQGNVQKLLLEDCYEAFCCAIVHSVNNYTDALFGPGMDILYRWSNGIMDRLVFDAQQAVPVQRELKEIWEKIHSHQFLNEQRKFKVYEMFKKLNVDNGLFYIAAVDPLNPDKVYGRGTAKTEKAAKQLAAEAALPQVKKVFAKEIEMGKQATNKKKAENKMTTKINLPSKMASRANYAHRRLMWLKKDMEALGATFKVGFIKNMIRYKKFHQYPHLKPAFDQFYQNVYVEPESIKNIEIKVEFKEPNTFMVSEGQGKPPYYYRIFDKNLLSRLKKMKPSQQIVELYQNAIEYKI